MIVFGPTGCGDLLYLLWVHWAGFGPVLLRDPSKAAMGFLVGGTRSLYSPPCFPAETVGILV